MVLAFQMDRTRKDESEGFFVCLFVLPAPQRKGLIIPHTCSNGKARHLSQKVYITSSKTSFQLVLLSPFFGCEKRIPAGLTYPAIPGK